MTPDGGVSWKEYVDTKIASLRAYVEQRFADTGKQVEIALDSSEKAIIKAEIAAEKRFEGVNEFRAALGDQQRTLMPRAELESIVRGIESRIAKLEAGSIERRAAVTGGNALWAWIVGALGALALLWNLFKDSIKP